MQSVLSLCAKKSITFPFLSIRPINLSPHDSLTLGHYHHDAQNQDFNIYFKIKYHLIPIQIYYLKREDSRKCDGIEKNLKITF